MSLFLSHKGYKDSDITDNPLPPRVELCVEHNVPNDAVHYLTHHLGPKHELPLFDLELLVED